MIRKLVGITFVGFFAVLRLYPLGYIDAFDITSTDIELAKFAKVNNPFGKYGRKFVLLGDESGRFEVWAYPLKLLREFKFSFFPGSSVRPIGSEEIVEEIIVNPAVTKIVYVYQSFTVEANYIVSVNKPVCLVLLRVDSDIPLKIVCSFFPVLQPMWPAGLGGQYSYWHEDMKAYVVSEPTGRNHAIVGSPCARGISYTPAHMLSDKPNEFVIEVSAPEEVKDKFIPIVIVGGKGRFSEYKEVYERVLKDPENVYFESFEHYRRLRESTVRVFTPDDSLNLAFEWAKIAYDNLFVDNPDLGRGLIAGLGRSGSSGRPGFGWFFGGDAYINILSLDSFNYYSVVKDALRFTQKWQREDGKMAHELTQAAGYVDWWNDYHYGYIHGDTTPYYILAVYDYVKMSGDVEFVKKSWRSLKKAYRWCKSTDENSDGLMDNRKAGLGATEYGEFTGVVTDIYLASVWLRTIYSMKEMAELVGDKRCAKFVSADYKKALSAYRKKFWDEESEFLSFAFDDKGNRVKEITPWSAVGLVWRLLTPEEAVETLEKINSASVTTDWGVRSVSSESKFYSPLNYNYGAVWPFITSWVATAQFNYGQGLQGFYNLKATADLTFVHELGAVTEVFSGNRCIWPQEAVSHQGFSSAGVILPFIRGLLGLNGSAIKKWVVFSPQLPPDWDTLSVENYRIGNSVWNIGFKKDLNKITIRISARNFEGYNVVVSPGLSASWDIKRIMLDGKEVQYDVRRTDYLAFPRIQFESKGENVVFIEYRSSLAILPPTNPVRVGSENTGLKILSLKFMQGVFSLVVEGRAGRSYRLGLLHPERVKSVDGADVEDGRLRIDFPPSNKEFVRMAIKVWIR